jgi:hypothetical protein
MLIIRFESRLSAAHFSLICLYLKIINSEKISNPINAKRDCPFETASYFYFVIKTFKVSLLALLVLTRKRYIPDSKPLTSTVAVFLLKGAYTRCPAALNISMLVCPLFVPRLSVSVSDTGLG